MTTLCEASAGSLAETFLSKLGLASSLQSRLRILDVGSGTARLPIEICRRQSGMEIIAADRRARIVRQAQREIETARLESAIHVHRADALALPYAKSAFDAVISNALLHHLPQPQPALREMVRVLRPGGLLFVRDSLRAPDADRIEQILSRNRGRDRKSPSAMAGTLTCDQVRRLVIEIGLPGDWACASGSRHWTICGRLPG